MAQNSIISAVPCIDASVVCSGGVQQVLFQRTDRGGLMIQAPSGSSVTFSFTNLTPAAGAVGCFTLAAGSAPVQFTALLPSNPMYLIGTAAAVVVIMVSGG